MNRSRLALFESTETIALSKQLKIPAEAREGLFKCRIEYAQQIEKIEFLPYDIRPVRSLQIVEGRDIDYRFKYTDRFPLLLLFEKRKHADDILIIKNELVTDSYYANLAFLKKGIWYTPEMPLLNGVRRQFLISQGVIKPEKITRKDLPGFEKIRLFNAMIRWDDELDVESIFV